MPILFQFSMSLAGLEITRKKPGDLGWDGTVGHISGLEQRKGTSLNSKPDFPNYSMY